MAASDELPRGSSVAGNPAVGVIASVVLPATPGVSHVVTNVDASLLGQGGAASGGAAQVQITDGNSTLVIGVLVFGGVNVLNTATWSGTFTGAVGLAVTISFSLVAAFYSELLGVNFYDI